LILYSTLFNKSSPIVTSESTSKAQEFSIRSCNERKRWKTRKRWSRRTRQLSRSRWMRRGNYYSDVGAVVKHKGLCAALSNHVFDYGQKGATSDQMRTTWEKIVHHVGTIYYGHDISNKLQNEKTVVITKPKHAQACPSSHTQAAIPKQPYPSIPNHTQAE
jgi:hypothetical protein